MAKMPIRNKSKDNPYTLGFDEEKNIYTVEFKDNKNILHKVEISEKVYEAFDRFELEDISQIHKFRSHIEHTEVYEETLNTKMLYKPISIEEEVENKVLLDDLKKAINCLTEVQKRRLKLYYFEDKTLKEIAELEHCSIASAKESIDSAINKLKKILKN